MFFKIHIYRLLPHATFCSLYLLKDKSLSWSSISLADASAILLASKHKTFLNLAKLALEKICEIGKELDILVTKDEVIEYLSTIDDDATKMWLVKARGGL